MITNEERKEIAEEIRRRETIRQEIMLAFPGTPSPYHRGWLGHPFTIIVLGGLAVTLAGNTLQNNYASQQQAILWQKKAIDNKYEMLRVFSGDFKKYVFLLYNLRLKQNFLKSGEERDFLSRDRAEVKKIYDEIAAELMKQRRGVVSLVTVQALFNSAKVLDLVGQLDKLVLKLQDDDSLSTEMVEQVNKEIETKWRQLITAMKHEVNQDAKRAQKKTVWLFDFSSWLEER